MCAAHARVCSTYFLRLFGQSIFRWVFGHLGIGKPGLKHDALYTVRVCSIYNSLWSIRIARASVGMDHPKWARAARRSEAARAKPTACGRELCTRWCSARSRRPGPLPLCPRAYCPHSADASSSSSPPHRIERLPIGCASCPSLLICTLRCSMIDAFATELLNLRVHQFIIFSTSNDVNACLTAIAL